MPTYTCPICGKRLSAMNENNLKSLIEVHMREHIPIHIQTSRDMLIQTIKNRIEVTKSNIQRLERQLKEQKGILKVLQKSLEMLEAEKR